LFGYSSPFSAHAARYSCRDPFREAQELADISGFYRAFGLAAEGEASEIGDHIAVELEFLGLAAYREGQALSEGLLENAGICREAQARFLADHLGRWAPAFFSKLVLAQAGVYSWLARTAVAFLDQEKEFLEVSFEPFQLPNLVDGDDEERGCGEIVECKM
ncbi:MAG: molecular chaperone TorD family protein, partial [Armatimonadetes bacterium]|nr:molecular chaperone TorD family protein [Armatimonadota bacterium]